MCEICEIKAKEIQRLHEVCQKKDRAIQAGIDALYWLGGRLPKKLFPDSLNILIAHLEKAKG